MRLYCFSYHVVALTYLRNHSPRKPSINNPYPLENENEDKKNKLDNSPSKRLRTSPACDISEVSIDPLYHWVQSGRRRKEYFEQDSQVREYFERGKSPKELGQTD